MTSPSSDNQPAIDWSAELSQHRDWLHGVARSRVGDAADDVMQEVSLAVIRQNGRPDRPEKIRAWLYQIVVRRVADHFRREYRQDRIVAEFADQHSTTNDEENGPDWVLSDESPRLLKTALEQIPDDERQMFLLKYIENYSYQQLAQQFEMSERAVEYRLVKAKQRLRLELRKLQTVGGHP